MQYFLGSFKHALMFTPTWGNDPIWRSHIVHSWVETQPPPSFPWFFFPGQVLWRCACARIRSSVSDGRAFFFRGFSCSNGVRRFPGKDEFNFRMGTHSCAWVIFSRGRYIFLLKSHLHHHSRTVPKKATKPHQPPWQKAVYSVMWGIVSEAITIRIPVEQTV